MHGSNPHPTISVVIPTYGRPRQLCTCLQALAAAHYPHERFEVIIVDDGNPAPLDSLVAPFRRWLNLRLLRQPNAGPAAARNTGAAHARGALLAFTDDDCLPGHNWLAMLEAQHQQHPGCMICGGVINALPHNPYDATSQLVIDLVYAFYNAEPEQARFCASNNMSMPTERFHALNGFDRTFPLPGGEDRDLCDRWRQQGYRICYIPEAVVFHAHALTLRGFWGQYFRYGRGARAFHQMRNQRQPGHINEVIGFHTRWPLLLRKHLAHLPVQQQVQYLALLAGWQLANAAGYAWEALAQQQRSSTP
jgi:GT2 family glycosyltransferase